MQKTTPSFEVEGGGDGDSACPPHLHSNVQAGSTPSSETRAKSGLTKFTNFACPDCAGEIFVSPDYLPLGLRGWFHSGKFAFGKFLDNADLFLCKRKTGFQ